MPHATVSTRDEHGRRVCPYCGYPIRNNFDRTCPAHRDLPAREPLDDRYLLTDTEAGGEQTEP